MAEINPFRGIRYNQQIVGDLSLVICPPYDVITPEEQKAYYEKSAYNIIRLEYSLDMPEDLPGSKYARVAATFSQWLNEGILQRDNAPAFYIHEHQFLYKGVRRKRLGFMACVKLEPWESRMICPHENTVPEIKSDRLELIRACEANISPLLALYEDPGQKVVQLLQTRRRLVMDFTAGDEIHKVWVITEPEFIQRISHFLASKPLYIADGHHRYETALTFQQEKKKVSAATGEEAFNFVMMTLVSLADPGLIVLPVHRLVRGLSESTLVKLKSQFQEFFEIKFSSANPSELPLPEGSIGVLGLEPGQVAILRLRPDVALSEVIPAGHSEIYSKLSVSLFQHLILEKLIGPLPPGSITYTPSVEMAHRQLESGDYQLAFLLPSIPVSKIKAIVDAGDRVPGKSTYFYPKLPTGLVINSLIGKL